MAKAKHCSRKRYWIPNSLSRYNGAIYAAVMRHISVPSFRERYGLYLERMRNYFTEQDGTSDDMSCLAEISAAGSSVTEEVRENELNCAVAPIAEIFKLDISRLADPEVVERGKLILESIRDFPKRLIAAAVLAGIIFAGGENWQDIAELMRPKVIPELAAAISPENTGAARTLEAAVAEEEEVFKPSLPRPLNGHVSPYMEPEHADRARDGIIKALGMANSELSEKTRYLYADYIIKASKQFRLNPALIAGVVIAESTGRTTEVSGAGARGLMQVMWSVHGESLSKKFGYKSQKDLLNPEHGLTAGCWILKGYLERRDNDIRKALSAYLGTNRSGRYYSKIMKWARLAQPKDHDFRFLKALTDGGFTNSEAEGVLKASVMLDELGPMDAEDLVETIIAFVPDADVERLGKMASVIMKYENTRDGMVSSNGTNALEAEYMLGRISPGFDRDLCAVQLRAKRYRPIGTSGERSSFVRRFQAANMHGVKLEARGL